MPRYTDHPIIDGHRQCRGCNQWLPIEAFAPKTTKPFCAARCRECMTRDRRAAKLATGRMCEFLLTGPETDLLCASIVVACNYADGETIDAQALVLVERATEAARHTLADKLTGLRRQ